MNDEDKKKSIKDTVLASIDAGEVTMRPKWHFVAKAVLLMVGIILATLALLYVVSFIIFVLHQTGVWFTPSFGVRGMREFLFGLPWILILLALLFIVVLQILVKKYSFGYGKPLLYSAVGIIGLVIIGGFIISLTPIHRDLFNQAHNNRLPFAGGLYRQYGAPPPKGNVIPGEIMELVDNGYRITTPRNEILTIIVTSETKLPSGNSLNVGDKVMIIGNRNENSITAYGIRELGEDVVIPQHENTPPHDRMLQP